MRIIDNAQQNLKSSEKYKCSIHDTSCYSMYMIILWQYQILTLLSSLLIRAVAHTCRFICNDLIAKYMIKLGPPVYLQVWELPFKLLPCFTTSSIANPTLKFLMCNPINFVTGDPFCRSSHIKLVTGFTKGWSSTYNQCINFDNS